MGVLKFGQNIGNSSTEWEYTHVQHLLFCPHLQGLPHTHVSECKDGTEGLLDNRFKGSI